MQAVRRVLGTQLDASTAVTLVTCALAFVIAEQLYKFHSFTLETLAFLATWWAIRRVAGIILDR